jgi:hypothetical protein
MYIFDNHIDSKIYYQIKEWLDYFPSYKDFNSHIKSKYNIIDFITNFDDFSEFKNEFSKENKLIVSDNRIEYGDFQTPVKLAEKICLYFKNSGINPEIIIEPTSGLGNFIISSIKYFDNLNTIYGIEINKNYVWYSKLKIIEFIDNNNLKKLPKIIIINDNIFDFNFNKLNIEKSQNTLVLGNPPWVTNATLTSLESSNLPRKTNFKNNNGIDAITGKGNFDISEYITLMIIRYFENRNAKLSFLVKNSVVKNIIFEQKKNKYKISNLRKIKFDAKKEFDVSVDACIFLCDFNQKVEFDVEEKNFDTDESSRFGWDGNKFLSNIGNFQNGTDFHGISQFLWRSGIKHDCTKIMELKKHNGFYLNKLDEEIKLEDSLIYSLIKGSYLSSNLINSSDLFTIVTQKKISEDTEYIEHLAPLTFDYLNGHSKYFDNRKSSIYKNKPRFSIFGVGDYSFKPYKIGISALYKKYRISLILPDKNNKPIMLDDTCYFLGFDKFEDALITYSILNNEIVKIFINSLTFNDIMRKYNKEVLMKIDFFKISQLLKYNDIKTNIESLIPEFSEKISEDDWYNYKNSLHEKALELNFS